MGLKKNNPGCGCCESYCYDCGESGKFNEVDVTVSGLLATVTVNFQKNISGVQKRVVQNYYGFDAFNLTERLAADPSEPDELCALTCRNELGEPVSCNQASDVTWDETIYANNPGAPHQCNETTVESSSSGTIEYTLELSRVSFVIGPTGIQPSGYQRPTHQDYLPSFTVSYDATLCAGDSQSSLFDSGNCSTANDFTYQADTSPILV